MKTFAVIFHFFEDSKRRRNLASLAKLLAAFGLIVLVFTIVFKVLMALEGQEHSWVNGIYWVFVTMSTLGYGDIVFLGPIGRLFTVVVIISGATFMLVLIPFMFIQFFYVPWMEAQAAAQAPRMLPKSTSGHVIMTNFDIVGRALIQLLNRFRIPYVVIVDDLAEALRMSDEGIHVMVGDRDDRDTYQKAQVERAAMVVTTRSDTSNTNIAFTVREISPDVRIVASASSTASVDILELAGCNQVIQLGAMLGQALSRRVLGRDARTHVVGSFGNLLIAEAAATGTPLVGRTLREVNLDEFSRVNVIGVWDRGRFTLAGPETKIQTSSVLLLSGTRADLDEYDSLFCVYGKSETRVIIIGGGRVGRATAKGLAESQIDYFLIEKDPARIRDPRTYILGDAAELEVLEKAGIRTCSTVVITSHDDDINVYLSIYCRKLRPDVEILARANQDRNASTLHRAGADFVMSYASMGSTNIYNLLRRDHFLALAEGLDVFKVDVPPALIGKSLAECRFRQTMGCNVAGIEINGQCQGVPNPKQPLPANAKLIMIGDTEGEERFFQAIKTMSAKT
ncbi:MAG: NAD-binding protein [Pirellulaceae bacterium]|nr:NAD-binding protein [Pirellulaceae bacterium]